MAEYLVNGYAYPAISEATLAWWLPRLTWLSAFSYGFTEDGDLIDLEDADLVTAANAAGVRPMMVLTPLDAEGNFNDNIAAAAFEDPAAQANLINNIEANLRTRCGPISLGYCTRDTTTREWGARQITVC